MLALMVAASVVVAASARGTSAGSTAVATGGTLTELDYVTNEPSKSLLSGVLNACAKPLGITVKRTSVPGDQLLPLVLRDASSHSLPGLLLVDNPWVGQIAAAKALTPLDTTFFNPKTFYKNILSAGSYKGKLYGVAPGVNALALFYNKDILAAAGIQPPHTWADLKAAAAALTKGTQYGLAFAAPNMEEASFQFEPFMWSNGGNLTNLASPQVVQALQYWVDLVNSGSVPKSVVNWTQLDISDQFAAGHVAMMVNGSWELSILASHPDLHYGIVPVPVPTAAAKPVVPMGGEAWVVPKTNQKMEANANAVLKCLFKTKNVVKVTAAGSYVPSQPAVAAVAVKQKPALKAFADEVATARSRTAVLGSRYPTVSQALWTAIQAALVGTKSPQDALDAAQKTAGG